MAVQNLRNNWSLMFALEANDITLANDERNYNEEVIFSPYLIAQTYGNRLPVYFDIDNDLTAQNLTLNYKVYNPSNIFVSQNYYNPNNEDLSCFSSSTSCDIGLTGIDNGLVSRMKGDNLNFTNGLYSDHYKFNRLFYDRRLKLFQVTSYTSVPFNQRFPGFDKKVLYEVVSKSGSEGRYHELYGGFYQGFYKLFGYDYDILPNRMNKGWSIEMVLKPRLFDEYEPSYNETTLNEIYPDNKNTFFYLGTRAENKFYHHANGSPASLPGYTRITSSLTGIETCKCCNSNITNSRCIYVYPPRSNGNVHDPHVNYGCPLCGTMHDINTSCGEGCNQIPCETCGWECQTHLCLAPLTNSNQNVTIDTTIPITTTTTTIPVTTTTTTIPTTTTTTTIPVTTTTTTIQYTTVENYSIENTCESDLKLDTISNAISFRLCGEPTNPQIGIRVLKFTGDCITTGTCETTGSTFTTGYTIVNYCTPPIYSYCEEKNPEFLNLEHWFQLNAVWERYTWLDDCDLFYRGGLGDITNTYNIESLANNTVSLITVPYTQENSLSPETIEIIKLNQKWLQDNYYRNGRLKIYINGRIFYTIENFEEVIPRALNTDKEKQVGVPFNISWGGGTQGLREHLTFRFPQLLYSNYIQDPECFPTNDLEGTIYDGLTTNILLEQNFAGTFEGAISQFRMYVSPLTAPEVRHNFNLLKNKFNMFNPNCPDCLTSSCEVPDFEYEITSIDPTPTQTMVTTRTPIPTITPSITPTNTITPSITPTNTITPSITPTNTITPSITPTNTVTPTNTITPSITPTETPANYLLQEDGSLLLLANGGKIIIRY